MDNLISFSDVFEGFPEGPLPLHLSFLTSDQLVLYGLFLFVVPSWPNRGAQSFSNAGVSSQTDYETPNIPKWQDRDKAHIPDSPEIYNYSNYPRMPPHTLQEPTSVSFPDWILNIVKGNKFKKPVLYDPNSVLFWKVLVNNTGPFSPFTTKLLQKYYREKFNPLRFNHNDDYVMKLLQCIFKHECISNIVGQYKNIHKPGDFGRFLFKKYLNNTNIIEKLNYFLFTQYLHKLVCSYDWNRYGNYISHIFKTACQGYSNGCNYGDMENALSEHGYPHGQKRHLYPRIISSGYLVPIIETADNLDPWVTIRNLISSSVNNMHDSRLGNKGTGKYEKYVYMKNKHIMLHLQDMFTRLFLRNVQNPPQITPLSYLYGTQTLGKYLDPISPHYVAQNDDLVNALPTKHELMSIWTKLCLKLLETFAYIQNIQAHSSEKYAPKDTLNGDKMKEETDSYLQRTTPTYEEKYLAKHTLKRNKMKKEIFDDVIFKNELFRHKQFSHARRGSSDEKSQSKTISNLASSRDTPLKLTDVDTISSKYFPGHHYKAIVPALDETQTKHNQPAKGFKWPNSVFYNAARTENYGLIKDTSTSAEDNPGKFLLPHEPTLSLHSAIKELNNNYKNNQKAFKPSKQEVEYKTIVAETEVPEIIEKYQNEDNQYALSSLHDIRKHEQPDTSDNILINNYEIIINNNVAEERPNNTPIIVFMPTYKLSLHSKPTIYTNQKKEIKNNERKLDRVEFPAKYQPGFILDISNFGASADKFFGNTRFISDNSGAVSNPVTPNTAQHYTRDVGGTVFQNITASYVDEHYLPVGFNTLSFNSEHMSRRNEDWTQVAKGKYLICYIN